MPLLLRCQGFRVYLAQRNTTLKHNHTWCCRERYIHVNEHTLVDHQPNWCVLHDPTGHERRGVSGTPGLWCTRVGGNRPSYRQDGL